MISTVTVTVNELTEVYQRSRLLLNNLSGIYIMSCMADVDPESLYEVCQQARVLHDKLHRIVEP